MLDDDSKSTACTTCPPVELNNVTDIQTIRLFHLMASLRTVIFLFALLARAIDDIRENLIASIELLPLLFSSERRRPIPIKGKECLSNYFQVIHLLPLLLLVCWFEPQVNVLKQDADKIVMHLSSDGSN